MYKINSLVFKWICFCLLVPFCLSCTDKAPEYPDLEGYWKQEWIEDEATDGQSECNRLFWAFQLGVSEIRDLGGNVMGRTCAGMIIMRELLPCVCIISG